MCTFRASCCSARLSRAQITAFADSSVRDRKKKGWGGSKGDWRVQGSTISLTRISSRQIIELLNVLEYWAVECIGVLSCWMYWSIERLDVLEYWAVGCIGVLSGWMYWSIERLDVLEYWAVGCIGVLSCWMYWSIERLDVLEYWAVGCIGVLSGWMYWSIELLDVFTWLWYLRRRRWHGHMCG